MRLLAYALLTGFLALGCGASAASSGTAGGHGGAAPGASSGSGTSTAASGSASGSGGSATASTGMSSAGTSSGSAASSSSGGTGGSTMGTSGDCHSDADCPSGHCVTVTPGGFRVCLVPPVKATTCNGPLDQCCPVTQKLCPNNEPCYPGPLVPVCSGVPMQPHNQCGVDQCSKDLDCAGGQICALAGTLGLQIRACVTAPCKIDADCTAHPGGICAPVQDPCCATIAGLYCDYPGNGGCRKNADCPPIPGHPSRYCAPGASAGVAACQDGGPMCPQ